MPTIMKIQLNTDKLGLWFLSGRPDLNMTFADPGPKELDWNQLTREQQRYLYRAIQYKQIISDIIPLHPDNISVPAPAPKKEDLPVGKQFPKETPPAVAEPAAPKKSFREKNLKEEAKAILSKRLGEIKQTINLLKLEESPLLNTLLKTEKAGKNRKTVLALLEEKTQEIQQAVKKNLKFSPDKVTLQTSRSNLPEIETINEGAVTIQLGSKEA